MPAPQERCDRRTLPLRILVARGHQLPGRCSGHGNIYTLRIFATSLQPPPDLLVHLAPAAHDGD